MKKIFLDYFTGLNYHMQEETEDTVTFVHSATGKKVLLIFSYYNKGKSPEFKISFPGKKIIVLGLSDIDIIGIEYFEEHENDLGDNNTVIIYDDKYIEHMMKDIWFFLNK
jgi:hypothetical protein